MRVRERLTGLLASLLILAILVGLPITLFALGVGPIPSAWPDLGQLRTALEAPDDGTLLLGAIKVIAWIAWAVLAGSMMLEVASRVRGVRVPHVPGMGMPQFAARQLVSAALLLFVAAPVVASASVAGTNASALPERAAPVTAQDIGRRTGMATTGAEPVRYTVRAGDTLSAIARHHLGDADRWPEIARLNPTVTDPDLIRTGLELALPVSTQRTYVVKAGDTLSGIAQRELGHADRYPEVFNASKGIRQSDGPALTDPDRIVAGQRLTIPAPGASPEYAATPAPTPRAATPAVSVPRSTVPSASTASQATETPRASESRPNTQPEPATSATSSSAPTTAPAPAGATHTFPQMTSVEDDGFAVTPWMVAGLTGGGAVLAGSLLMVLRQRRRAQFRHRRPGRTLAQPEPVLVPVERTITAVGQVTAPTVEHMDAVLRRLAAVSTRDGLAMPELAAVQLTATDVVLHLGDPAALSEPWVGSGDGYHWRIAPSVPLDDIGPEIDDQPAPYPLLLTIGTGDDESVWLLNIEDLTVAVTGDATFGVDFMRYLAAEVACNPWSSGVRVDCLGVASEVAPLNPDRIRLCDKAAQVAAVEDAVAAAVSTIDRVDDAGLDVTTARAHQAGDDAWGARLLLVDATSDVDGPTLDQLVALVRDQPGRTATSVILHAAPAEAAGIELRITADGRVSLPSAGLDLIAVGLTSDEAQGCAALLAHRDAAVDPVEIPVDEDATVGWRAWSDQAGALRPEHALHRTESDADDAGEDQGEGPSSSVLDEDDEAYVQVAATTPEDLQAVAPRVAETVRYAVEHDDPSLDDDVATWFSESSALPKLHLLGPVRATTRGKALVKRKPYMTELLTYIALRPHGATAAEVSETFGLTKAKTRGYVQTVREWLGTNPRTGDPHVPDARLSPSAQLRGMPVYEVVDLLIDLDLFRRLRVRGQARGAEGIEDLRIALRLVEGRPFDYPIEREAAGGWSWLIEGDRLDEHAATGIIDVAHVVVTHALATEDVGSARWAVDVAARAEPHSEVVRLDLAAVATAEGRQAEAQRIIRDDICNRTDDENAPPELPDRTSTILDTHRAWTPRKAG